MPRTIKAEEPICQLIRHAGWSLADFRVAFGYTKGRLTHQGQFRYNHIAQSLIDNLETVYAEKGLTLDAAARAIFDGRSDLQNLYAEGRLARRRAAKLPLRFPRKLEGERAVERLVRTVGGISTLSRLICVNEFTLRRYVQGITKELPADIAEAVRDTGWRYGESFIRACAREDEVR